jgi:hypothetical protein
MCHYALSSYGLILLFYHIVEHIFVNWISFAHFVPKLIVVSYEYSTASLLVNLFQLSRFQPN